MILWTGFDNGEFMTHDDEAHPRLFKTRREAVDYFGKECVVKAELTYFLKPKDTE